jgi:hypothetical protein
MGVAVRARAAGGRSRVSFGESASPSIDPWSDEFADRDAGRAGTCPEIDCVRALLARDVIEAAEDRAAVLGVGADRVLIAAGALSEEAYLRALGDALGVAFEPLDDMPRTLCPLNDDRLIESAAAGMLPLAIDDELYLVVAPRGGATRRILHLIEENPARAQRFRYTSAERLNRFVLRCAGTAIAARAANSLKQKWPMLSAAPPRWRTNFVSVAIVMLLALAAAVVAPAGTMLAFEMALAAVFLAWLGLRLTGAFVEWLVADPLPGPPDDALPVYTVIAALYREAASVDGLLTAIERLDRLPLPLGGSSNHFHTASLRAVGGWDPYNVTEDADLGMRFARFGYRSSVLNSTTYEEAPARFGPWLRQRTRWFKGWMQTWAVHMRQPARLLRDLGLPGFLTFQLIVGGNALAALVHPLFLAALIYSVASGAPMWRGESATVSILAAVYGMTVVIGYLTSAFLGWLGLLRRGLLDTAWVLVLTPVHWLLLSLAAWRALYQLAFAPYAWEKTEHGLAKSSRRAANLTRSLLALERHLSALKEAGELPTLVPDATSHGSGRHRLPQDTATTA